MNISKLIFILLFSCINFYLKSQTFVTNSSGVLVNSIFVSIDSLTIHSNEQCCNNSNTVEIDIQEYQDVNSFSFKYCKYYKLCTKCFGECILAVYSNYQTDYPLIAYDNSQVNRLLEEDTIINYNFSSHLSNSSRSTNTTSVTSRHTPSQSTGTTSITSHHIYIGPRGGRYYINKNGNRTYIKRR